MQLQSLSFRARRHGSAWRRCAEARLWSFAWIPRLACAYVAVVPYAGMAVAIPDEEEGDLCFVHMVSSCHSSQEDCDNNLPWCCG